MTEKYNNFVKMESSEADEEDKKRIADAEREASM